jgi:hypothetical protein
MRGGKSDEQQQKWGGGERRTNLSDSKKHRNTSVHGGQEVRMYGKRNPEKRADS